MSTYEEAQTFHDMLKRDLVAAMKTQQAEAVAALRTAIAAIDNAQAADGKDTVSTEAGLHVATAGAGVGSTEVLRRQLSLGDMRKILQTEITDRTVEAERYDAHGAVDAADRLRREADVLAAYLQR